MTSIHISVCVPKTNASRTTRGMPVLTSTMFWTAIPPTGAASRMLSAVRRYLLGNVNVG